MSTHFWTYDLRPGPRTLPERVRSRRPLVILVAVLALVGLVVVLSSGDGANQATRPADPTRVGPAPRTVTATIPLRAATAPTVRARIGDLVELTVPSGRPGTVTIDGYDRVLPVDPDSPARFSFTAEVAGSHPILLAPDTGSGEPQRLANF